eukprot:2519835-Pleurochrysis_carterae.AAC.4
MRICGGKSSMEDTSTSAVSLCNMNCGFHISEKAPRLRQEKQSAKASGSNVDHLQTQLPVEATRCSIHTGFIFLQEPSVGIHLPNVAT